MLNMRTYINEAAQFFFHSHNFHKDESSVMVEE